MTAPELVAAANLIGLRRRYVDALIDCEHNKPCLMVRGAERDLRDARDEFRTQFYPGAINVAVLPDRVRVLIRDGERTTFIDVPAGVER